MKLAQLCHYLKALTSEQVTELLKQRGSSMEQGTSVFSVHTSHWGLANMQIRMQYLGWAKILHLYKAPR